MRDRILGLGSSPFGVSSIAAHELYYGAAVSPFHAIKLARTEAMSFEIVSFDEEDAKSAARVRAALRRAGKPIGPFDVLIAGQALRRGLILITHNTREFSRVEGLKIEDWEV